MAVNYKKGLKFFFRLLGFLTLSILCGGAIGYILLNFYDFDIVHRDSRHPSQVAVNYEGPHLSELPLLPDTTIKNVILFIGDGMGINQITAARYRYYGPNGRLNMERMPVTGLVSTFPAGEALITDSGAGATALATGRKTANGMISLAPDSVELLTIMEAMRDAGYATGLISTSDITDATPAAFASHVPSRKLKNIIARQLIDSRINFMVGGGETFHGSDMEGEEKVSAMQYANKNGYKIITDKGELLNTDAAYVLALFEGMASDMLEKEISFNANAPTLAESTRKAIDILREDEKGFILVVEEEGTDTGSHINRPDFLMRHLKNLDDAVKVALEFAKKNKKTLVLVTADHETGGLTFSSQGTTSESLGLHWSTSGHTGQPVPLFAFGPHAIAFTGVLDNTDIPKVIADKLGLDKFLQNFEGEKENELTKK